MNKYEGMMYILGTIFLVCFIEIFFLASIFSPIVTHITMILWVVVWIACIVVCEILIRKSKYTKKEKVKNFERALGIKDD